MAGLAPGGRAGFAPGRVGPFAFTGSAGFFVPFGRDAFFGGPAGLTPFGGAGGEVGLTVRAAEGPAGFFTPGGSAGFLVPGGVGCFLSSDIIVGANMGQARCLR